MALTNQASTVQRLQNLDAPPFIPPHLRVLFDSPPDRFIADKPPFEPVFGSRCACLDAAPFHFIAAWCPPCPLSWAISACLVAQYCLPYHPLQGGE